MFDGIDEARVLRMTDIERRWLDNIKKAFHKSDTALQDGTPQDGCLDELFKAIDTAKTLRRSLRGETVDNAQNRRRFIDFLALEIPAARPGEHWLTLRHARTGEQRDYNLGDIIYDIRCMVHENENLDAAENVDYHILLDWSSEHVLSIATVSEDKLVCNAHFLWNRLRQVLSKFITGIEAMESFAREEGFSVTISPPIGSIRPQRHRPSS